MANVLKTRTFWSALATGAAGILAACGVAPPVTEVVTWAFATLTTILLRAGVLKSGPG